MALSLGPSLTDTAMSAVYIPSRLHALGRQGFLGSLLRTFYFSHVCAHLGTKHFGFETGSLTDFLLSLMASKPQGCVCLSPSLPEAALASARRHAWLGHGC